MAFLAPMPLDSGAASLSVALAKIQVADPHVEFTTALSGVYDGRDLLERSTSCVRKASPSCAIDGQQKKKPALPMTDTFDFVPPPNSPNYPRWAIGRQRTLPKKPSKRSRLSKSSSRLTMSTRSGLQLPLPPTKACLRLEPRDEPLHLLTLAPEIRNLVFEFVIGPGGYHDAQLRKVFVPRTIAKKGTREVIRRFPVQPTIALVNKQLRSEVLSMFYGGKSLEFKHSLPSHLPNRHMAHPDAIYRYSMNWTAASYLETLILHLDPKCTTRVYEFAKIDEETASVKTRTGYDRARAHSEAAATGRLVGKTAVGKGSMQENIVRLAWYFATGRASNLSANLTDAEVLRAFS